MNTPPFAVILPAAGSGKRFGAGDKLLVELVGQSVLARSAQAFARRPDVGELIMVTAPDRFDFYRHHLQPVLDHTHRPADFLRFIPGGRERWESVLFGLRAVSPAFPFVAIHDAARPLVTPSVIDAAFDGARTTGGSVPVLAEPATLKRLDPTRHVTETVSRAGLYQAQTPQCFDRAKLLHAFETLLAQGQLDGVTDDAQVFEKLHLPVAGTPGAATNLKITTAEDVVLGEAILRATPSAH